MTRKIISFFTFGLFLILVGGIGKIFNWDQALIFIGIGLTLESLALILFAWNKIKK